MIEMHLTGKDKHSLREKVGKACQTNRTRKQENTVIPILDKVDFRPELPRKVKETGIPSFIKQTLML